MDAERLDEAMTRPIDVLLVEDNPGDADLTRENLEAAKVHINLHLAVDGVEALRFLRHEGEHADKPQPDLILLDLNLPRKDGRETLREIRADSKLRLIPTIVLTSSAAERDVVASYELGANAYVTKPVNLAGFAEIVRAIEGFWFTVVKLPSA
jgi:CheY-like chemotaxis protein